jgi:hypothetical protein
VRLSWVLPGGNPVSGAPTPKAERSEPAQHSATVRAAATWFLAQATLPRHQTVRLFAQDFRAHLEQLIPRIQQLAGSRAKGDAQAMVALAGVGEARRRLGIAERPGLNGEVERVKRLARSVIALRDHYDALTGVRMCLVCDHVIEDGDEAVPYRRLCATDCVARSGHIHRRCCPIPTRPAR